MGLEAWRERAEQVEREVRSLYLAGRDPRTPWYAKAVVLAVVGYALSPVDPIPDFVPVLGYLDELLLLPVGAAVAMRLVPDDVVADCRAEAAAVDGGLARWGAAAVTLLLWAALGYVAVRHLAGVV